MKKIILFILAAFSVHSGFSQNTISNSGNVGIGTLNPGSPLTVMGDIHSTGTIGGNGAFINVLKILPLDHNVAYFYIDTNIPANDTAAPQIQITGYMYAAGNKAMKITLGWYHYLGNFTWSQWQSDLGYQKPSRVRLGTYLKNGSPYIRIEISNNSVYWANYTVSATDYADFSYVNYNGWTYTVGEMPAGTTLQIHSVAQNKDVIIDGNLGIGTPSPTEKLAVNGNIRAREVKVEAANWPDFVFAKAYQLPTLQEIELHIKEKGHLPCIPSAEEVKANGIDLGEMNAKLLQKIEELTLHLIDQNKKMDLMQKENQSIKSDYQELKKMMIENKSKRD